MHDGKPLLWPSTARTAGKNWDTCRYLQTVARLQQPMVALVYDIPSFPKNSKKQTTPYGGSKWGTQRNRILNCRCWNGARTAMFRRKCVPFWDIIHLRVLLSCWVCAIIIPHQSAWRIPFYRELNYAYNELLRMVNESTTELSERISSLRKEVKALDEVTLQAKGMK